MSLLVLALLPSLPSRRRRRRRWREGALPPFGVSCCAALLPLPPSAELVCLNSSLTLGASQLGPSARACPSQRTQQACERTSPVSQAEGAVCVWLGGECVGGTPHDCEERWEGVDWYGEESAFEPACEHACPGFVPSFVKYARRHREATRE